MFCLQESEGPLTDPFASVQEPDPLNCANQTQSSSSDDEPNPKRPKIEYNSQSLNLKVYKIPSYNTQTKNFPLYPTNPNSLPKFVNNPLNLANPLALNAYLNKPLQQNRQPLPSLVKSQISMVKSPMSLVKSPTSLVKLPSTPANAQSLDKSVYESSGGTIRYKKNGEIAKKRGPPKGYKRKPKELAQFQNLTILPLPAQNTILTSLLASTPGLMHHNLVNILPPNITVSSQLTIIPQVKVPEGVELIELNLDPANWFPDEPYKMIFSRKKNPKWKQFPYRCEHCFKGYRVASTLLSHAADRHGSVPKDLAIPCPCCPHVSVRRKLHKKHLETHSSRRGRLFCLYCVPLQDPSEPFVKESEKYPFDKFPQYWYASEESLRLHKKRKHPYAAMFNYNWFGIWGDSLANS